jgi:hypothetical protein
MLPFFSFKNAGESRVILVWTSVELDWHHATELKTRTLAATPVKPAQLCQDGRKQNMKSRFTLRTNQQQPC